MRLLISIFALSLLAGCSSSPPKPASAQGEYRPINRPADVSADTATAAPALFDFHFEGDIRDSLLALKAVQPQINVLAPAGRVSRLPIKVALRNTNLEGALRAIGSQGGNVADLVWNTTASPGGDQVFIRFRAPVASASGTVQVSRVALQKGN